MFSAPLVHLSSGIFHLVTTSSVLLSRPAAHQESLMFTACKGIPTGCFSCLFTCGKKKKVLCGFFHGLLIGHKYLTTEVFAPNTFPFFSESLMRTRSSSLSPLVLHFHHQNHLKTFFGLTFFFFFCVFSGYTSGRSKVKGFNAAYFLPDQNTPVLFFFFRIGQFLQQMSHPRPERPPL